MFPGGIADKAGNRYEAKWAVRSLLDVILGSANAIRLESLERTARGFEFELHRNGSVEWHQTKRQGQGNWTLTRLQREEVLTNFGVKLASSPANRCVFVSTDPAKEIRDLVEKACLAESYDQFDRVLSDGARPSFLELQTIWGLTPDRTFSALRHCEFTTVSEIYVDRDIEVFGGLIFDSPTEAVFPALREYLEHNLNRLITTEVARAKIRALGHLRFRDSALDPTLRERVRNATERYLNSYIPFGCGSHTILRRESGQVVDLLSQPEGPAAVLLTGVAGSGKSGIVREVIGNLSERSVPVFAFRVDRVLDVATITELGNRLIEQRGNPCTMLSRLFPSEPVVMVVDQLDAISEASGRAASTREVVFELVDAASRLNNVRLLLVCRSFDLDNDARLKTLAQNQCVRRIDVPVLDWEQDVGPVLTAAGVHINHLTPKQRTLLTLPINLSIFLEVADETEIPGFSSTTDLFDRLVEYKDRALRERGIQGYSLLAPLTAIAHSMSTRQLLDGPEGVLDDFPGALDFLASEHLIVRQGGRVAFFHESFFDYVFSRDFVRNEQGIIEFLSSDEQHLFRRTQVRQILTAYRQIGPEQRYLTELRDVLTNQGVRYHLKDAIARWLGTVDIPTDSELDVVLDLARECDRPSALLRLALYGNPAWFPLLRNCGLLKRWLDLGGEWKLGALFILETATAEQPDDVSAFMRSWWNGDPTRSEDLLKWFSFLRQSKPSHGVLHLYLDLIRSGPQEMFQNSGLLNRHELTGWIKNDPAATGEVFKAWFETWFAVHPEGHPFERDDGNHLELYWIAELAKASPAAFLSAAVTAFVRTIERISAKSDGDKSDWTWRFRHRSKHLHGSEGFLEIMRSALRILAEKDPGTTRDILATIDPRSHSAALYLHLEVIAAGGAPLAALLIPLATLEGVFEAGPNGADWLSFAEAARSALPHLSLAERIAIENLILDHWPEITYACRRAEDACGAEPNNRRSICTRVLAHLRGSGFEQWAILKTIGNEALTANARRRLAELERKFGGTAVPQPTSFEMIAVESPIPEDRARYMTDQQWLEAIRTHNAERDFLEGRWRGRGGAAELAQVLHSLAKEQPARFAQLMSHIPVDSPRAYRAAILRGLSEAKPELHHARHAVNLAHSAPDRPFGREICRLIEKNPAIVDDEAAFDALCWYVEHGEADSSEKAQASQIEQNRRDIEHVVRGGTGEHLYIRGINDVRGSAAEALGAVIWDCPDRLKQATVLLEQRIEAEAVRSVRCCLIRPLHSMLRHDPSKAAALMQRLIVSNSGCDLTPLMTHIGVRTLYYVLRSVPDVGREVLDLLLASTDETAHLIGAHHLFREALGDNSLAARADALIELDLSHRLLAAEIAAANVEYAAARGRIVAQLLRFFDDPDKDVRIRAAQCFRHLREDDLGPYRQLIASFIASRAFEDENFAFFMLLNDTSENVYEEVVAASEQLIEIASREAKRNPHLGEMHYLDDLIIREYAGLTCRPKHRRRILDVIDRMLELGLHGADQIVAVHERMT